MLRSRQDLARLAEAGRTRSHPLLVVHYAPNALDHDRFALSTGRRLGGAVARNRLRRRLREILRRSPNRSGHGWDMLIVARPTSLGATFEELRTSLERLLAGIRASVTATAPMR
jgi:ribonuclease P protein component